MRRLVTVPGGWRYHPSIVAQPAATLAEMYPGRFGEITLHNFCRASQGHVIETFGRRVLPALGGS